MKDRIEQFIESDGTSEDFERLALETFAWQYARVEVYRRVCESRGIDPEAVRRWQDIPPLPADAFKQGLGCNPKPSHVFLSSGTVSGRDSRSRHELSTLSTYRASALRHFARMVVPDHPGPMSVQVLGPTAETHPDSSLGQMFSWIRDAHAKDKAPCVFDLEGKLDAVQAVHWLRGVAATSTPVLLLGISSAFTAIFAFLRNRGEPLRLPADSRIVDTGGKKGSSRVLSARGHLKACWRYLHVPSYMCVNEYGMTEMLSQYYDDALFNRHSGKLAPRRKIGPPWCRHLVVNPATLEPVRKGSRGILRYIDLSNWESVSALQTLDIGVDNGAGLEILGRARGEDARGCSQLMGAIGRG